MARSPNNRPLPLVQATCVLIGAGAVLIRGEPGSGKSALAAALLGRDGPRLPVRLVADDAVSVVACGDRLVAIAPDPIRGLMEMRGVGIIAGPHEPRAVVRLVVDMLAPARVERLPGAAEATVAIAGVVLPRIAVPAGDPAATDRVLAVQERIAAGTVDGIRAGNRTEKSTDRRGDDPGDDPGAGATPRIRA
ncbi:HPr kinase/phosphorylase [Microbaculum sp. FT89]|uniref:HPr kinase/phosphorylase n=1 Tax=Microbaculum sp. FT89 TaxID=3447298 RepID=UPI003F53723C